MIYINICDINKIIADTAYTRLGGTEEELRCAGYIVKKCSEIGLCAVCEPFKIRMYDEEEARLCVGDKEIKCKAIFGMGNGNVKAELYYLEGDDEFSLKNCKDKIVLSCKPLGYKLYEKLKENGAVGVITYSGSVHSDNNDVDRRRIGYKTEDEERFPAVHIHIKDAFDIVKNGFDEAEIVVKTKEYIGLSHNVIADIKGKSEETVVITAHYDSTENSKGVFDNVSGCIALLYLAEHFAKKENESTIRLIWCGSEEYGLLGSRAYCKYHSEELLKTVLNINLDMLGCVMGGLICFSCADEQMTEYLEKFVLNEEFSATVKHAIRSSDSNSFLEKGTPAVSFGRYGSGDTAPIHTRYDTPEAVSGKVLLNDMEIVRKFTDSAVNSNEFPKNIQIADNIRTDIEKYFSNKKEVL